MVESTPSTTTAQAAPAFKVGQEVQFMHATERGTSIRLSTRYGKIVEFSTPKGLRALVRTRNGRQQWVRVKDLRSQAERSPVCDVVDALSGRQGSA